MGLRHPVDALQPIDGKVAMVEGDHIKPPVDLDEKHRKGLAALIHDLAKTALILVSPSAVSRALASFPIEHDKTAGDNQAGTGKARPSRDLAKHDKAQKGRDGQQ